MNAATVSRTLSLIPERVARTQSGGLFDPQAPGACPHPERIVHLSQFLNWLGPLQPLTKEDLKLFGLITPYGKPAIRSPMEDDADVDADSDLELEAEADLEPEAEAELVLEQPAMAPEREPVAVS